MYTKESVRTRETRRAGHGNDPSRMPRRGSRLGAPLWSRKEVILRDEAGIVLGGGSDALSQERTQHDSEEPEIGNLFNSKSVQ